MTTSPPRRSPRTPLASPWITVQEAAAYLGVGVDTIYDACAKRGLKHVKLGHATIRLQRAWVDAWAEQHGAKVTT
ncbi:MAG: helix-turn-helix domain-containing protein [Planctomycetota bacterium]|nr:MAG: helix-turn-helix domain-containing protein [Planctomycetota bacterium]